MVIDRIERVTGLSEPFLNGSLLNRDSRYFLVYREPIERQYRRSALKWCEVDKRLCRIGDVSTLAIGESPEDPRVFEFNGHIYMTFAERTGQKRDRFAQFLVELTWKDEGLAVYAEPQVLQHPSYGFERDEKNWMPFVYDCELHFVHSVEPHTVLRWDVTKRQCSAVFMTHPHLRWSELWGEPKGGTRALPFGNAFVSFFHSWVFTAGGWEVPLSPRRYFVGAYLFYAHPPFEIVACSVAPLHHPNFFSEPNILSPHDVVFPSDAMIEGDEIAVLYGDQDSRIKRFFCRIDTLVQSLCPCTVS